MADTVIMQILQWAIPSGGIGAAIAWVANRKVKSAETAKSVHDTYKVMYEDVSALLVETQKKYEETTRITEKLVAENNLTRRAVNRLSRAIEAIQLCPHRTACPVSSELQLDEADGEGGKPNGGGKRGAKGQRKRRDEREEVAVDGAGKGGHGPAGDSA